MLSKLKTNGYYCGSPSFSLNCIVLPLPETILWQPIIKLFFNKMDRVDYNIRHPFVGKMGGERTVFLRFAMGVQIVPLR